MLYKVLVLSSAEKDFASISVKDHVRIATALRALAEYSTTTQDIQKLRLPLLGYRKRVGVYRILFDIVGATIVVHAIRHRKDAYR